MLTFGTGIIAAFALTAPACHEMRDGVDKHNSQNHEHNFQNCPKFQQLCRSIGTNQQNILQLVTTASSRGGKCNDRGVRLTQRIHEGSELLRIPLSKCLRDDRPPEWLDNANAHNKKLNNSSAGASDVVLAVAELDQQQEQEQEQHYHEDDYETHIDKWSTRLAASLIDLDMNNNNNDNDNDCNNDCNNKDREYLKLWKELLPDPTTLRASLPVHWSDEALASTQCAVLELASDAAFFARAEAVNAILDGIQTAYANAYNKGEEEGEEGEEDIIMAGELEVHQALDLVQTRSCRVRRHNGVGPALRLLAPVFDFINHGSGLHANAVFDLEDDDVLDLNFVISADVAKLEKKPSLVVRASRDIDVGEELLIDYGDSARPEWKCLSSYGFVPKSCAILDDDDDVVEDCSSAEIYMDGKRYEIGPSVVPTNLVLDVADTLRAETGVYIDEENPLTADVALSIAKRVSDVAGDLLDFDPEEGRSPAEQQAFEVAAQFRRSQHDILILCAAGLREYAHAAAQSADAV
mmetsp:Transcript_9063/g.13518  ORF Transcript_9063/g.13518 Transcript_9063/m.13518 type:complete len:522 (-) Transcript_9063:2108-3673(-)